MANLTSERLQELRRIAETATPGPWRIIPGTNVFSVVAPETQNQRYPYYRWAVIADTDPSSVDGEQAVANACYIAAFHPSTVLAMLDEIERLWREREVLATAVMGWQRYLERDLGTGRVHLTTLEAHEHALALLDGEKVGEAMSDRCPKCGAEQPKPIDIEGPWSYYGEFFHEIDGNDCIRRQLEQAKAEIERLRREREVLAAGLIDSEECVKVLLDLFPNDVRPGVASVVDMMGRRRRTALALLDGEEQLGGHAPRQSAREEGQE